MPMVETFNFPLPPTLNEIIRMARGNIYASAKEKRTWTNSIALLCVGKKQFPSQVWLEFVWQVKNKNSDADNISASAKFVMDGLVQAGVLQGDSLKYIMSPVLHWYEKGDNSVQVKIADYSAWYGDQEA